MPISGHVQWVSVMIKGNERDGFLGSEKMIEAKGDKIRKKWQSAWGKKLTYSVYYWMSCFFSSENSYKSIAFFCLTQLVVPWFYVVYWHHIIIRFFHFPDGTFFTVETKTGLSALLKHLARLHNRHRDTSPCWQSPNAIQCGRQPEMFSSCAQLAVNSLIGLCLWGNWLNGQVMFSVGWWFGWRWLSEAALWQWDNKSGGESLYPWQHMSESEQ